MNQFVGILAVLLMLFYPPLHARDYSQLFEQLKSSVVILKTFSSVPSADAKKGMVSQNSLGSGVVISDKGQILTAAHVVQTVDSVHVEFTDGTKILGKIVASDPDADLAMLQLERLPENLSVASMGNSDLAKIGHEIFVIGAPLGFKHTLTVGNISSRRDSSELERNFRRAEFFQIDAAINPGNSGGPVFNLAGEVIGIASHIQSLSGGSDGLGFAVTSNSAADFIKEGPDFWSGLSYLRVTPALASIMHYPLDHGVLVQNISSESPAAKAGIRGGKIRVRINNAEILLGGDVIVSVMSIPLEDQSSYKKMVKKLKTVSSGQQFNAQVYRRGVIIDVNITKP